MSSRGERRTPEGGIRALDPFRDLKDVVDLISLAFGDRLDPAGRATLERMRRFASSGPLMQGLWALLGKAAMAPGLVWVSDGEIVGNVSVRRSRVGGAHLIGNVVVHPDYRGQGIGGALMRRVIKAVSRRGAGWVGLEVRAHNGVARSMYEGFSFREVGRTHHLIREGASSRGASSQGGWSRGDSRRERLRQDHAAMRRGGRRDADALVRLMKRVIPEEQRPLLEATADDYRPGWARRIDHWLRCEDEVWWVVPGDDQLRGAVRAAKRAGGLPHRLEALVTPSATQGLATALVRRGLSTFAGSERLIASAVPDSEDSVLAALRGEGFREVRVLIQMKRELKHRISVQRGH